ncbi:hypothetical protein J4437_05340 [Candidatus Woesearchaeota archaeon]|nr:hypothetical protein [Candidatus Woesearchaeota archaeon]
MKKRFILVLVMFLLVLTSLTLAVDDTLADDSSADNPFVDASLDTSSDCGFFCKIGQWWTERMGGEAAAVVE